MIAKYIFNIFIILQPFVARESLASQEPAIKNETSLIKKGNTYFLIDFTLNMIEKFIFQFGLCLYRNNGEITEIYCLKLSIAVLNIIRLKKSCNQIESWLINFFFIWCSTIKSLFFSKMVSNVISGPKRSGKKYSQLFHLYSHRQ